MITLSALLVAASCFSPACCIRHGVPAICRSPVIERQAKAIVMRQCPRCNPRKVKDWIYSYQMNRGPYANAAHLAVDVLQQVKP
jgi:hypothetical protein